MEHTANPFRKDGSSWRRGPSLQPSSDLAPAYPAHNVELLQQRPRFRRHACSALWRQAALCNCCQSFSQLSRSRLKATSKMVSFMLTATLCSPGSHSAPTQRGLPTCTWPVAHLIVQAMLALLLPGLHVLGLLQPDPRRALPTPSPISFPSCAWPPPSHRLWS